MDNIFLPRGDKIPQDEIGCGVKIVRIPMKNVVFTNEACRVRKVLPPPCTCPCHSKEESASSEDGSTPNTSAENG